MRTVVLKALLISLGLSALAVAALVFWMRGSLPANHGEQRLDGIAAEVEIIRDGNGVPHIFAKSPNDGFFALGFAHAEDRLWQLEINRRIASGSMAEILGPAALPTDRFLRTLGLRRIAERTFDKLDFPTRKALEQYAAGINAHIAGLKGALPPEFLLTQSRPAPWQPADSIAWLKMMAWDLGGNLNREIDRLTLLTRLPPAKVAEFLPPYPGDAPYLAPDPAQYYPGLPLDGSAAGDRSGEEGVGSNNWVLAGSRSLSGKPLLANDPHLGLGVPGAWYLAHLDIAGRPFVGATLPGLPFLILGRNDRLAWGFTNTDPDVQDLYIEKLVGPDGYQTETGPRDFVIREEVIQVRGQSDQILKVRISRHGPVVSDAMPGLAALLGEDHVAALRWTALDDDDKGVSAALALMQAGNAKQLMAATADFSVPMQNIVYADVDGDIGFIAPGKVPIRNPDSVAQGMIPARGWTADDEWLGWIPRTALPHLENPMSGMIVTANAKIIGDDYPYTLTRDWALPYRVHRIEALLNARSKHDRRSLTSIQTDKVSPMAVELKALMLDAASYGNRQPEIRAALAAWDGAMRRELAEPLLFTAWHRMLAKRIYADELGPLFERFWAGRPQLLRAVLSDQDGEGRWCDDVTTDPTEVCAEQASLALDDALDELSRQHGRNWRLWRWGNAHVTQMRHRPFSAAPLLDHWFNIELASDGGPSAINVATVDFAAPLPYRSHFGPSFRAIYDLADLDASLYVIAQGQSGNPFSRHYDDLARTWRDGRYITIPTRRDALEGGAAGLDRLKLRPRTRK